MYMMGCTFEQPQMKFLCECTLKNHGGAYKEIMQEVLESCEVCEASKNQVIAIWRKACADAGVPNAKYGDRCGLGIMLR